MFAKSNDISSSICTFYLFSSCTQGPKCRFLHDIPKELYKTGSHEQKDQCYFFLKGKCDEGEKCNRSHSEPPCLNGTIRKICLYYSQGNCKRGKLCSYIHDVPDNSVNIVNSESSYISSKVPKVVINASDDMQSMVDVPKHCRFYRRGMCFFGDHCKSFHDKPDKDLETLFSDLRKDEALKEMKEINKLEGSSNTMFVATTNDAIVSNDSKVLQMSSNWNKDCRDTSLFLEKASNLNELTKMPTIDSKKPKESIKSCSTNKKLFETSKSLIAENNLSKYNEFQKTISSSLKYSKGSYRFPKEPLKPLSGTSSKKKEYAKGSSSKSKEFVRDYQKSIINPYSRDIISDRNPCISSKSNQFYRSKGSTYKGYTKQTNFLNESYNNNDTSRVPYSSYPISRYEKVSTEPREYSKNGDRWEKHFRTQVKPKSAKVFFNTNEQVLNDLSIQEDSNDKRELGTTRSMTRKQSKSQRKPKSENVQLRVIFKSKKL